MKATVKCFNFIGSYTDSTFVLDLQSLSDQPDLHKEEKKLSRTYKDSQRQPSQKFGVIMLSEWQEESFY